MEHTTLTQLVENNATLTASVAALTASVTALTSAYTLLANVQGITPATLPLPTQQSGYKSKGPNLDPTGYCWMHGYRVKVGHNSTTCSNKADGHQNNATGANTMGGSINNKPKAT